METHGATVTQMVTMSKMKSVPLYNATLYLTSSQVLLSQAAFFGMVGNDRPQSHKLRYAFVQVWVARENRTPFTKGWEGGVPLPLCVCTHCVHSARAGAEPWTRAAPHPEQCWSLGAGYLP